MVGNKFLVIGVGKYGAAIARTLSGRGAEVYVIDVNEDRINNIKDDVTLAITMDSSDIKAMQTQDFLSVDAAIIAIGENFEGVILTAVNLMEIGIKRVIVRASGNNQRIILQRIGVEEILTPEVEVANSVSEKLLHPSVTSFIKLTDDYEVVELKAPLNCWNKKFNAADFNKKYNLKVIAIKQEFQISKAGDLYTQHEVTDIENYNGIVSKNDTLVIYGKTKEINRFIDINFEG
ncbi:MAG: potassium channel family protein [Luteibaculaceae bacterium]